MAVLSEKKREKYILVVSRGKKRELLEWMEVCWEKKRRKEYDWNIIEMVMFYILRDSRYMVVFKYLLVLIEKIEEKHIDK